MKRYFTATGLILLLFIATCANAEPTDRYEEVTGEQDDFGVVEKLWQESAVQIPDLPADDAWVTIPMDSLPATQKLALEKSSILIDKKDWVVRYWLLIRSTGGAYNASYQGLRCRTSETVTYAYGQKQREPMVSPVKEPRWVPIGQRRKGNYAHELSHYIFCSGAVPRTPKQMQDAIEGTFQMKNPYQEYFDDY
jgi:hypothetical protein